ncbi:MAG: hypothetical protein ACJASL_002137 [Paraglaciecola sp.]|jgi:hypothetical protein
MQLLNQSEISQTHNGSKISQQLFWLVVEYLSLKLLMTLQLIEVLGHKTKSIFCVLDTNNQQHYWHASSKAATYSHRENWP